MTRYGALVAGVLAVFLAVFAAAEGLGLALLEDPASLLDGGDGATAVAGTGLLVADVVLPVPSSVVMVLHGARFGLAAGAALSLLGAVGAALAGYGVGRGGGPALLRSVCSEAERARADGLVRRWGLLAVAVTRPVPLLAETTAVVAGASSLVWWRTAVAAAAGSLPAALLYAAAGASGGGMPSGLAVFAAVTVMAGGLWLLGRRFAGHRLEDPAGGEVRSRPDPAHLPVPDRPQH